MMESVGMTIMTELIMDFFYFLVFEIMFVLLNGVVWRLFI